MAMMGLDLGHANWWSQRGRRWSQRLYLIRGQGPREQRLHLHEAGHTKTCCFQCCFCWLAEANALELWISAPYRTSSAVARALLMPFSSLLFVNFVKKKKKIVNTSVDSAVQCKSNISRPACCKALMSSSQLVDNAPPENG